MRCRCGSSADGSDERYDLALAHGLAGRPRRELVDLRSKCLWVVADELDERCGRLGFCLHAALPELLGDPALKAPLGNGELQDLPRLRARFPERRRLLDVLADESEDGVRRRIRQIGVHCLDVGGFPAALAPLVGVPSAVDVLDDDQSRVTEEAPGVAERDRPFAGGVQRAGDVDRFRARSAP